MPVNGSKFFEELMQHGSSLFDDKYGELKVLADKDASNFCNSLNILPSGEATAIFAVAVHHDKLKNPLSRVKCRGGTPIGGYSHDQLNDCYYVRCVAHINLGWIPISFKASLQSTPNWAVHIPMPEEVFKRYLDSLQMMNLEKFKNSYSESEYTIQYFQLIS